MAEDRIRAGVIGLGDIATKAYLPVLATRADVQLRLCTRDRHMLDAVAARFRVEHRYVDVADLVAAGLDAAFVHVATVAHVEIVGRLLDAGVPTYVDKPLASDLVACSELVERAASRDCSLLVGFNRRHAPIYRELRDTATSLVFMQKNRVGLADAPRHVVFDDFVHVVDTLRFLAPQAELTNVQCVRDGPNLDALVVFLVGGGTTAIGAMNRNGGHTQEIVETHGVGRRRVVHDMATLDDYRGVLREFDMLLVMTVEPGFGGQAFMADMMAKVAQARQFLRDSGSQLWIQVDGGVAPDTIAMCAEAGADMFVAGSAVFGAHDPAAAVKVLRERARAAISS